ATAQPPPAVQSPQPDYGSLAFLRAQAAARAQEQARVDAARQTMEANSAYGRQPAPPPEPVFVTPIPGIQRWTEHDEQAARMAMARRTWEEFRFWYLTEGVWTLAALGAGFAGTGGGRTSGSTTRSASGGSPRRMTPCVEDRGLFHNMNPARTPV